MARWLRSQGDQTLGKGSGEQSLRGWMAKLGIREPYGGVDSFHKHWGACSPRPQASHSHFCHYMELEREIVRWKDDTRTVLGAGWWLC